MFGIIIIILIFLFTINSFNLYSFNDRNFMKFIYYIKFIYLSYRLTLFYHYIILLISINNLIHIFFRFFPPINLIINFFA